MKNCSNEEFEYVKHDILMETDFPFRINKSSANVDRTYLHTHECLEINYVISGSGKYHLGHNIYSCSEGDLFLINNIDFHLTFADPGSKFEMYVITFLPEILGYYAPDDMFNTLLPFYYDSHMVTKKLNDDTNHALRKHCSELILSMDLEFNTKNHKWHDMVRADIIKLLALVSRQLFKTEANEESRSASALSLSRVRQIVNIINRDFAENITIDDFARETGVSASTLAHCFKNKTGYAPIEFLLRTRIGNAIKILATTDKSILETAYSVGFNSYTSFSSLFKKATGMTPRNFKKRYSG